MYRIVAFQTSLDGTEVDPGDDEAFGPGVDPPTFADRGRAEAEARRLNSVRNPAPVVATAVHYRVEQDAVWPA